MTSKSEAPAQALPQRPSRWRVTSSPPVMTEGSSPAPRRISKIMATVVDLPLVPVTATVRYRATKCASSSERCSTGTPSRRAATTSGTSSSTAVDTTRAAQSPARPEPSCGWITTPRVSNWARASGRWPRSKLRSLPLARPPFRTANWARALMPLPATPAKCSRPRPNLSPGRSSAMSTGSPSATRSKRSTTSALASRTQPWETGRPSWPSWLVPWM